MFTYFFGGLTICMSPRTNGAQTATLTWVFFHCKFPFLVLLSLKPTSFVTFRSLFIHLYIFPNFPCDSLFPSWFLGAYCLVSTYLCLPQTCFYYSFLISSLCGQKTYFVGMAPILLDLLKPNLVAGAVTQWIKLLPVVLASHVNASLCPRCSPSDPVPC